MYFLWLHKESTKESAPRGITLASASARCTGSPPRPRPKFARPVDSPRTLPPVLSKSILAKFQPQSGDISVENIYHLNY